MVIEKTGRGCSSTFRPSISHIRAQVFLPLWGGGGGDTNLFHDGALRLGVVQGLEKSRAVELEQGALLEAGQCRQPLLGEDAADDLCAGWCL